MSLKSFITRLTGKQPDPPKKKAAASASKPAATKKAVVAQKTPVAPKKKAIKVAPTPNKTSTVKKTLAPKKAAVTAPKLPQKSAPQKSATKKSLSKTPVAQKPAPKKAPVAPQKQVAAAASKKPVVIAASVRAPATQKKGVVPTPPAAALPAAPEKATPEKQVSAYVPATIERDISRLWEAANVFHPAPKGAVKNAYSIMLPPPNVTGTLHLGHAATVAIEDALARYQRMQGKTVLYLPGTDHAGISTQVVVEKELAKEGKTRFDLSREEFLARIWDWKKTSHATITNQIQRLGGSLDWERERFTLDDDYQKAVFTAFKKLYDKGLIYRDKKLVNWSPKLQSVVSDLEVLYKEEEGNLYFVRYFVNATDKSICVATTRPETMLGDTAVAVHPEDERYKEFIGKELILPITNRLIPVIADTRVDRAFGTGAVKITPAHDPLDAAIAKDHKLESIVVIGPHGKMTKHAGKFRGLPLHEARASIVRYLDDIGNLEKIQKHTHSVAYCERTGERIEPIESMQWFVQMRPLADMAIKAVKKGEIQFVPARFETEFLRWMENIHDWCISRQLVWGHQIPVWHRKKVQSKKAFESYPETLISEVDPSTTKEYAGAAYERDPDVLDTWFSSGLWPFATLGWPKKTADLDNFFPNAILETGRDILFFWVARMVTMSLALTGKVPFKTVYLHGLVVDEEGKKMSKSKGNGIDPLDMVEKYGTDALRIALMSGSTPGTDTRFGETKITGKRNFVNKLFNASRFVLMSTKKRGIPGNPVPKTLQDKWILSRLHSTVAAVTKAFDKYAFSEAIQLLEDFVWKDFCDWYLELSKDQKNEAVLLHTLGTVLHLLHPFAPFITEHLYGQLTDGTGKPLAVQPWPKALMNRIQKKVESDMAVMITVISGVRSIRTEYEVEMGKPLAAVIYAGEHETTLKEHSREIKHLARLSSLTIKKTGAKIDQAAARIEAGLELYLPLSTLLDPRKEKKRLTEEQAQLVQYKALVEKKLGNKDFIARAPKNVVEAERVKLAETDAKLAKITERLHLLA